MLYIFIKITSKICASNQWDKSWFIYTWYIQLWHKSRKDRLYFPKDILSAWENIFEFGTFTPIRFWLSNVKRSNSRDLTFLWMRYIRIVQREFYSTWHKLIRYWGQRSRSHIFMFFLNVIFWKMNWLDFGAWRSKVKVTVTSHCC